jgi:hypothetical protein
MAAPIPVSSDFTSEALRAGARRTRDAEQVTGFLAFAAIYDGGSRGDGAQIGGVGLQILRDRVPRFVAAGPEGPIDLIAPGVSAKLNDDQRRALAALFKQGIDFVAMVAEEMVSAKSAVVVGVSDHRLDGRLLLGLAFHLGCDTLPP